MTVSKIRRLLNRTWLSMLFLLISVAGKPQVATDSCTLEISLLTCSPGTDLYSIFGHTAIRVRDEKRGMDVVYNYGTFDDTDPAFYLKFTRGIMRYSVSAETLDSFIAEYQFEQRSVMAQVLNLSCDEKKRLYESLRQNTLEENRLYDYHFHTDNCTTRAGRIIEKNVGGPFAYKNILPQPGPTFRDMIHEYLDKQHQDWSKFGIDLLLGKNLDIKPTNEEAIHFLPDYLYRGMDSAVNGNQPMVRNKKTLISFPSIEASGQIFSPLVFTLTLLLISILLSVFITNARIAKTNFIFDIIFFSVLGLLGLLIATVWLIRIDDVCRDNINLLWALPTHLFAVFSLRRKSGWVKYYFLFTAILATILLLGFAWWTQRMNLAVLPILGMIVFRSFRIYQNRYHAKDAELAGN